ncbi:hypothetical protein CLAFUW4_14015 [Fulvia fulva]|nr:hypothetical protein CLAFUR4_14018 [Fulvia fulva]KAK4611159.1 hypothetical protein CLAFUR0_14022 [Fulvia fulva]WPV22310.1 hypothetical protein CLAFUW4_14015 [Fulvia fulva]
MSSPRAEREDKARLLPTAVEETTPDVVDSIHATPKLDGQHKPVQDVHGFLSAPFTGPIRPLSPDTLSILSADGYDQVRPSRRTSIVTDPAHLPRDASGWRAKLQASWLRNKGLAFMLAAQIFGTLMNVTTRLLEVEGDHGKGLHPFQILFARMGITFVLASGYMWYKRTPHFPLGLPEVRWLLVARGFGGFFGVFGIYYSLLYLPLADAAVLAFLAPGLACWVCSFLIGEPFTRIEKIGTLISLVGVVFIARPTTLLQALGEGSDAQSAGNTTSHAAESDASNYENVTPMERLMAVGIAMIGVCGTIIAFTTIRWIGKRAHPLISVNYFAAWCTLVSFVMQLVLPNVGFLFPTDLKEWGYLFFLGVCGFIMQFLLAAALSYEKSSRATNMTYTQMLFALAFDKWIFDHTPGVLSIIGSCLILGSAIVVALQKDSGSTKGNTEGSQIVLDEEAQRGLLSGMQAAQTGEDNDRLPVQEMQLRTLR